MRLNPPFSPRLFHDCLNNPVLIFSSPLKSDLFHLHVRYWIRYISDCFQCVCSHWCERGIIILHQKKLNTVNLEQWLKIKIMKVMKEIWVSEAHHIIPPLLALTTHPNILLSRNCSQCSTKAVFITCSLFILTSLVLFFCEKTVHFHFWVNCKSDP